MRWHLNCASGGEQHLYIAVRFDYTQNGQGVVYAMGESWLWDGVTGSAPEPGIYQVNWARQFR